MAEITEEHKVPKQIAPIRLQEYGVGIFYALPTKSGLKKALKKEYIRVNGVIASTATFIKGGEIIELNIPVATTPQKQLIFKLKVLFEDEYLALVHKPAGILVSGNSFYTIANALSQNLKLSTQSDATKPQPVHRLDYATTGVLLVGKTSKAIRALNKLFEDKAIQKTYYAIAIGEMDKEGVLNEPIDGKKASSVYKVVQTADSPRFNKLNLVQLEPQTGRRHQLRKHLFGIGHPILGDKEYFLKGLVLNGKGVYLHACGLKFIHPITNEAMEIKDPLPKKFLKIFPDSEVI
ncbi:23S rRNA pseudouridine1911/1915/1917 synthase [Zhouia amylolytica]|uniref:23S rRNA pseudouridine1911/1915/1917 synthase n=1 Tax=Zhouia amylolytica TaxID=376730 RepID=A0A1I6SHA5_9FLAO|nr:RluA family pseudouridine synthase [Zhouia amylolytica]MCQ0111645.1 RluA family pseudouridine synthase [Zhouia amylolytica]SFS76317.1 23S rRNA pseudouridine1911/1915/1917 synthase [Zhouia amylolytica]